MNSLEAELRKQQSTLICSGIAIILFGVWSIIRIILMFYFDADHLYNLFDIDYSFYGESVKKLVVIMVLILLFLDLIARTYIGLAAIKEGSGELSKRITYIVVAVVCMAIAVTTDVTSIVSFFIEDKDYDALISAIVDISIHIATVELVVAAIKARIISKKLNIAQSVG